MTSAQARVLLEALRDWHNARNDPDSVAFVGRALLHLPEVLGRPRRVALDELGECGALARGDTLTPAGVSLARQVGYALRVGEALPSLAGEA